MRIHRIPHTLPGLSPLRSDGLTLVRREDGLGDRWPKVLKWVLKNDSRQPGDLLKNRHSDSLNAKLNLLFLRGMLKRWNVADEDYEVKTTIATDLCSIKWGLKKLSVEPSIYGQIWPSKLLPENSTVGGGGEGCSSLHISHVRDCFSPHTSMCGRGNSK